MTKTPLLSILKRTRHSSAQLCPRQQTIKLPKAGCSCSTESPECHCTLGRGWRKSSVYSRAPTTKKGLNAVEAASTYPVRGLLFLISKNCVPVWLYLEAQEVKGLAAWKVQFEENLSQGLSCYLLFSQQSHDSTNVAATQENPYFPFLYFAHL